MSPGEDIKVFNVRSGFENSVIYATNGGSSFRGHNFTYAGKLFAIIGL